MFSQAWLQDTLERALSTAAQAILTVLSLDATGVVNVNVDLKVVVSTAAFAALYAVLKAIVAAQTGSPDSASLVK